MSKTISTKVIVLKKTAYQESSLIVSSISGEYGKIDFVVKGARRITKKSFPIVDVFHELAVEYRESKSGLHSPLSIELVEEYDKIALNPDIFVKVFRLSSFLLKNIYPRVPCDRVYSAFKNLLKKAADGNIDVFDFVLPKLVFLSENGLLPEYFEGSTEEKKQQKFLNRIISYAEGRAPILPNLSVEYQSKFSNWVENLCRYNDLI